MNNEFNLYLTKIFKDMENERHKLSHPFVGSEHLLLSLLKNDKTIIYLFHDYKVTYDNFYAKLVEVVGTSKKNVDFNLYTPLLKRVINYASEEAKLNKEELNSKYLIESLLEENEGVAIRILIAMDVDLDDLYKSLNEDKEITQKDIEFGKNLNKTVSMEEKVIGRDKEILFMIETLLRKKKNNPLLIGEAGVGKSAIVEEFSRLINSGKVPKKLRNATIISLDMASIVGGTKYRGEFEEKLNKIIETSEKNENIILFIDEIHTISSAGGAEGAIGAGDIFKPYLARGCIKVIGATTTDEYEKYILKDKALARRFETIMVKEPTINETIDILTKIKKEYENYHNVLISKKNIIDIISLADKFIINKKNPDKSIDFLDSVASYVQIKKDNTNIINKCLDELNNVKKEKKLSVSQNDYDKALVLHEKELILEDKLNNNDNILKVRITLNDIYKVLESKINVPCLLNKKKIVDSFKNNLNKHGINNEILINEFSNKINNLGKVSSVILQGDSDKVIEAYKETLKGILFIKINGYDFQSQESIIKLIGNYQGYSNNDNYIFKKLKSNPYALIYIENFDALASNIKSLFKDILKIGVVNDEKMDEISFKNSFIVASTKIKDKDKVGFSNKNSNKVDFNINFNEVVALDDREKQI